MRITGPFVEYKCSKCDVLVSRKINVNHAKRDIEELRGTVKLLCAQCGPANKPTHDSGMYPGLR